MAVNKKEAQQKKPLLRPQMVPLGVYTCLNANKELAQDSQATFSSSKIVGINNIHLSHFPDRPISALSHQSKTTSPTFLLSHTE